MSEPVPCVHWSDCGLSGRGCCAINKYNKPSRAVCLAVCDLGPKRPIAEVMPPPAIIDPDYVPTPVNATLGGCGCKK